MAFTFEKKKEIEQDISGVILKLIEANGELGSWTGTPDSLSNTVMVYDNLVKLGLAPTGLSDYDAAEYVDNLLEKAIDFIQSKGTVLKVFEISTIYGGRADSVGLYNLDGMGYAILCEGASPDTGEGYATINFYKDLERALKVYEEIVKDIKEMYEGVPEHRLVIKSKDE
ncbi:MAG: hypothetical protein QXT67_04690 [Candidatus Bathyarchaeia archaeon]